MPKQVFSQPAIDYHDQLEQLKQRGLIIEDDQKALHLLANISYFRLSEYWYPMLDTPKANKIFKPRSTLTSVFQIYCFDRELRKLILGELEKIEIAVRAKMIYILSMAHGPFWYKNTSLFVNQDTFFESLKKLRKETKRSDERFIKNFENKYINILPPSWMLFDIVSFGTLSSVYKNLKPGVSKREVARYFGLDDSTFESWLHSIVYLRNVCAHHSRIWNRAMSIRPKIPLTPQNRWIANCNNIDNQRVFFVLSMVYYLLLIVNPNTTFKDKLLTLFTKYPNIHLRAMGFPDNWQAEELWT